MDRPRTDGDGLHLAVSRAGPPGGGARAVAAGGELDLDAPEHLEEAEHLERLSLVEEPGLAGLAGQILGGERPIELEPRHEILLEGALDLEQRQDP